MSKKKAKHNEVILNSKEIATHCYYCEQSFEDIKKNYTYADVIKTIDHFYPLRFGGKNENENKVICCFMCNNFKAARKPRNFIKLLQSKIRLASWQKSNTLFDFDMAHVVLKNMAHLISLQEKDQLHSTVGYFIQLEKEPKVEEIITIQSRILKPLNWLTYGE